MEPANASLKLEMYSRLHCTFNFKSCGGDYRQCECETVNCQSRPNKRQRNAEARVDMQCSSLWAEAFLAFDRGSQPTLGQQITDMLPTVGRQTANSRPTVGQLSPNSWPTVGPLLTNSRPTVFWRSCSSLFPNEIQVFAGPKLFNLVM